MLLIKNKIFIGIVRLASSIYLSFYYYSNVYTFV